MTYTWNVDAVVVGLSVSALTSSFSRRPLFSNYQFLTSMSSVALPVPSP